MAHGSDYFDELYRASPDPWHVQDAWYERRKRALILAALCKPRYQRVFEPACGAGELTRRLARRCDHILACDYSEVAVDLARAQLSEFPGATIEHRKIPQEWPDPGERFDLILISELAYYLDDADLLTLATRCVASLLPGGELLACHFLRPFHDRLQDTQAAHALLGADHSMIKRASYSDAEFLLDVWSRPELDAGNAT